MVDEDGRAPYGVDMRRPEHPPVASSRAGERCGQKRLSSETFFFFEGRRVRVAGRERVAVGLEGGLVRVALPRLFIKGGECVEVRSRGGGGWTKH